MFLNYILIIIFYSSFIDNAIINGPSEYCYMAKCYEDLNIPNVIISFNNTSIIATPSLVPSISPFTKIVHYQQELDRLNSLFAINRSNVTCSCNTASSTRRTIGVFTNLKDSICCCKHLFRKELVKKRFYKPFYVKLCNIDYSIFKTKSNFITC